VPSVHPLASDISRPIRYLYTLRKTTFAVSGMHEHQIRVQRFKMQTFEALPVLMRCLLRRVRGREANGMAKVSMSPATKNVIPRRPRNMNDEVVRKDHSRQPLTNTSSQQSSVCTVRPKVDKCRPLYQFKSSTLPSSQGDEFSLSHFQISPP
jgi:hypothetical protein